jgi:hypothetical protein
MFPSERDQKSRHGIFDLRRAERRQDVPAGDKMEVFLVFVFALILSTLILSAIVGDAANTRHRNAIGWFVLSVLITHYWPDFFCLLCQ